MPTASVNGATLHYEVIGSGAPIALTPGARLGRDAVRSLAKRLASHHRVIIYDRRNCGESDIVIAGEPSESALWADDLYALLRHLDAVPAYVGGGSAGCRVSLLLAIRHPETVRGLLLWWVTGGATAAERLGQQYYGQFVEAAQSQGMAGVIATPFFAERVQANPKNRRRLLEMDPREFVRVMRHWRSFFTADSPVIGATPKEISAIRVPAVIVSGDDAIHPRSAADALHRLINGSELHPPLWSGAEVEAFMQNPTPRFRDAQAEVLAAVFHPFLAKIEAAETRPPAGRR